MRLQPALTETKYWNEFVRTKADEVENKNDWLVHISLLLVLVVLLWVRRDETQTDGWLVGWCLVLIYIIWQKIITFFFLIDGFPSFFLYFFVCKLRNILKQRQNKTRNNSNLFSFHSALRFCCFYIQPTNIKLNSLNE